MSIAKKLIKAIKNEIPSSRSKLGDSYRQLVKIFPLQLITSQAQHMVALKVIEKLIAHTNSENKKDDGLLAYIQTLSNLISDYEKEKYKAAAVSGREMLVYLMELQGLTQKDLSHEIGGQPVVSKILSGERELNLRQIKALAKRFRVSPEVFI